MGIEDRDWYRAEPRRRTGGVSRVGLIVGSLAVALALFALSPAVRGRLGFGLPFGMQARSADDRPNGFRVQLLPGGARVTLAERPLYARDDPWRAWLAGEARCPGGEARRASAAAQARTMLCLVNFARRHEGLRGLRLSRALSASSASKAADIIRCGQFQHGACGKSFDQVARDAGYRGSFGENLYIAEGQYVVPRVAVDQWLNSAGHRENLFRREWRTLGIARRAGADVGRIRDGVVWVNQFGA